MNSGGRFTPDTEDTEVNGQCLHDFKEKLLPVYLSMPGQTSPKNEGRIKKFLDIQRPQFLLLEHVL